MNRTTTMPEVEGWYWLRLDGGRWTICEVQKIFCEEKGLEIIFSRTDRHVLLIAKDCEWVGPIEPPCAD